MPSLEGHPFRMIQDKFFFFDFSSGLLQPHTWSDALQIESNRRVDMFKIHTYSAGKPYIKKLKIK